MTKAKKRKLSDAMISMLRNVERGLDPNSGHNSQSHQGGRMQTWAFLRKHGLLSLPKDSDKPQITDAGRKALADGSFEEKPQV